MSHYFAAVVVPPDTDHETLQDRVGELLQPFDENDGDNPDGKWDWWVIGGRWTGVWSDYDPTADPRNHKTCWLCQGTGMRNDPLGQAHRAQNPDYTCNGCMNGPRPGVMVEHASNWVRTEDDLVPLAPWLAKLTEERLPYAVVTPDGWAEYESWTGETFVKTPDWEAVVRKALAPYPDHLLAVVDYHS